MLIPACSWQAIRNNNGMTLRTPDSRVPAVERRSRRRILTLRNVRNGFIAALAVVAALNIRSEMRDSTSSEEFGRLYQQDISKAPQPQATAASVMEIAPVDEAASADPFALDAARREQYLGSTPLEAVALIDPVAPTPEIAPADGDSVRIVGGPEGVTLVREDRKRGPALGGGFGRQ